MFKSAFGRKNSTNDNEQNSSHKTYEEILEEYEKFFSLEEDENFSGKK
jgi:hypothetical protein